MGKSKPVSSTATYIIQKNVRSWETLELSTLIVGLLRTAGIVPCPGKINRQKENNAIVNNAVDVILLTQKVSATNHEAQEFLDSDYYAKILYQDDKMSLEETKENIDWRKISFEYKRKSSYWIENRNYMTRIHNNEDNNIAECNLLHDIINPSKRAKILNVQYSHILHGCINTRKVN